MHVTGIIDNQLLSNYRTYGLQAYSYGDSVSSQLDTCGFCISK